MCFVTQFIQLAHAPRLQQIDVDHPKMRTTTVVSALLPTVLSSVIPATEEISPALSFDKRQDLTAESLGGKILQADVYAGIAGLNQQVYQATQQSSQWKTCNPSNIIVRREW